MRYFVGSELGADFEGHRAWEVIDVTGLVDRDVRVELAVAAKAVIRVRRVVLEVEGVDQVDARRQLEVLVDGKVPAGLQVHRAVAPDIATKQELARTRRRDAHLLTGRAVAVGVAIAGDGVDRLGTSLAPKVMPQKPSIEPEATKRCAATASDLTNG